MRGRTRHNSFCPLTHTFSSHIHIFSFNTYTFSFHAYAFSLYAHIFSLHIHIFSLLHTHTFSLHIHIRAFVVCCVLKSWSHDGAMTVAFFGTYFGYYTIAEGQFSRSQQLLNVWIRCFSQLWRLLLHSFQLRWPEQYLPVADDMMTDRKPAVSIRFCLWY